MTAISIALITYASLSTGMAALALGLYFGERRRSETLENLLRSGTPEKPMASIRPAPTDTEAELTEPGRKRPPETMIQAVADGIFAASQDEGRSCTPAQARQEAETLLNTEGAAPALFR